MTTPTYALPYPDSNDYVIDGAAALQDLAEATDSALNTIATAAADAVAGALRVDYRQSGAGTFTFTPSSSTVLLVGFGQWISGQSGSVAAELLGGSNARASADVVGGEHSGGSGIRTAAGIVVYTGLDTSTATTVQFTPSGTINAVTVLMLAVVP